MLNHYNPLRAPNPQAWMALDETERILLVRRYHERARARLPSPEVHEVIHVVVENQAAMGDETPVTATLERLVHEELDRHDAIHAVRSVLAEYLWEGLRGTEIDANAYHVDVAHLTAESWLESFRE